MKLKRAGFKAAVALLLATAVTAARAEDFSIQSFDGTGRLTYSTLNDGTNYNYRVEWAPSPAGPWTNTWKHLAEIPMPVSGVVTCSVPMCYRVVAIPSDYVVVDLAGGPTANSYPVSYLGGVPSGGWSDEYKTTKLVLRRIPATAAYTMGSPSGELGRDSDETQHTVELTKDEPNGKS